MSFEKIKKLYCDNLTNGYAFLDKSYNLIESKIPELTDDINKDDIAFLDFNKKGPRPGSLGQKNGVIKAGDKLLALGFSPVIDQETEKNAGYLVKKLSLSELLGDKFTARMGDSIVKENLTTIYGDAVSLGGYLSRHEMYNGTSKIREIQQNCMDATGANQNSILIESLFDRKHKPKPTSLKCVLENVVANCKFDLGRKFEVELKMEGNPWTMTEEDCLMPALVNLIINAYIYGPLEFNNVTISVTYDDDNAYVAFDDCGYGLGSPSARDPFVDTVSIREGLGLTYVTLYTKLFGGDFRIVSKGDNEGTSACLTVPLCPIPDKATCEYHNYREGIISTYTALMAKSKFSYNS